MRPKKIAFYGNFGSGNLGNECTLQAVLEHVRHTWPDAQLICLCTVPEDVRSRHQISAVRSALTDSGWTWAKLGQDPLADPPEPHTTHGARRAAAKLLRLSFRRIPLELAHWVKGFTLLLRADMLIIPGTQVVSDYLCGPSGWPYDIFKWSMLAALCRADVVFLSVGVGPVRHRLSRWLIGKSLNIARYRSYRDEQSRRCATGLGVSTDGDGVYPDLVFSLSPRQLTAAHDPAGAPRVVGLGLKDLSGATGPAGERAYAQYMATMADFVSWLHAHGYRVRLLIGDVQYDLKPRRDFYETLRRRNIAAEPPLLVAEDIHSVDALVDQLRDTDVVVSPRLHNLILATMLGKPVIALSDHAKLDALLAQFGLTDYRVSLEELSAESLIERFRHLEREAPQIITRIRTETDRCRLALSEQYGRLRHLRSQSA